MNSKKTLFAAIFLSLFFIQNNSAQIGALKRWLSKPINDRPALSHLKFSKKSLTKSEAATAANLLLKDKQAILFKKYEQQWDDREFVIKKFKMPFFYQIFGKKPKDGRSLFISLHGGGNAPASLNDGQYENQKHLYYKTMQKLEGVYMALRAPTNTWDLWHQAHIDDFLNIIIQMAVIRESVNPNKVYILGYSAGGDGVYQLAPRMADRWAAASMMAGHPGDASALSLRNTPFSIHVGALDKAYDRNNLAKKWGVILDSLQKNDPQGYKHFVEVHEGMAHWMKLSDSVALPWMHQFKRNPIPKKVVWRQDNRHHTSFYWIGTPKDSIKNYGEIRAAYNSALNEINIITNYSENIQLFVNDEMLNLDKPITIKYDGKKIYKGNFDRSIINIYNTMKLKGDINLTFPTVISVINNKTIKL